ncbi:hypothetical protein [Agrobacterium sp. NPDC090273]|uniref:hypothetical protein n=1 Tax=Agrobacterium sp. NPDC090273 TaxID=3363919 RepID=UPI00383BC3BA
MTTLKTFQKKVRYQAVFIGYFAVFVPFAPCRRQRNISLCDHGRFVAAAQQRPEKKLCKTQKKRPFFKERFFIATVVGGRFIRLR